MRSSLSIRHLLFALVVVAFISLYPQLDAAGYCDGDGCPKVTYGASGSGAAASGVAGASGVSLVVAALVMVPGVPFVRAAYRTLPLPVPGVLVGVDLPPDVPPPRLYA